MDYQQAAELVINRLKNSRGDGRWDDHLSLATWEWPQGVAMYAMMKVYHAQKDPESVRDVPSANRDTTARSFSRSGQVLHRDG